MSEMPKMRTAKAAYAEIHRLDPNSSVSLYMIRTAAKQGRCRVVSSGRRVLLDLDSLLEYFSHPQVQQTEPPHQGIRPIRE